MYMVLKTGNKRARPTRQTRAFLLVAHLYVAAIQIEIGVKHGGKRLKTKLHGKSNAS